MAHETQFPDQSDRCPNGLAIVAAAQASGLTRVRLVQGEFATGWHIVADRAADEFGGSALAAFAQRTGMLWGCGSSDDFGAWHQIKPQAFVAPTRPLSQSLKVPPRVCQQLSAALATLAEIGVRFSEAKHLDVRFSGQGRYVADTWGNRGEEVDRAMKVVAEFRTHAPRNGVDGEAVIAELGGLSDFPLRPGPDRAQEVVAGHDAATSPSEGLLEASPEGHNVGAAAVLDAGPM